jgi:1A family penicillin-binding protein
MIKNKRSARSHPQRLQLSRLRQRKKKRRFFTKRLILLAVIIVIALFVIGGIIVLIRILPLLKDLPSPDGLTQGNARFSVATQIFDRHGNKLYELYDDERRLPVKIADLPPYVGQASIAIEDKKFYSHHGFDPWGILRAFIVNRTRGELAQGGSTITQQLMKKAFLTDEKSYDRKIKEIALALITEARYSKEQILEMYLNYIPYGGTAVGIGSAAEAYFNTSADKLTLAQASLLAGLPQAPSRYSPFQSDRSAAKNRQKEVLKNMVELGFITQAQADEALEEELVYTKQYIDINAPHFVFYVRDYLIEKYGQDTTFHGGLRVTTTLDLEIQDTIQASLSAELATLEKLQVGNGAALVTNPQTGEILAMVGSKDYFDEQNDGQVNVTTSLIQPGSSIKPLVYAAAFEQKALNPASVLLDVPTCFKNIGEKDYCPRNYSGSFHGPTTVRQALGSSLNIPAVKTLRIIGLESFIDQATQMGITTWTKASDYGWSLSLGGGEVRMVDMVTAFGVFANQGVKVPLASIIKIEDYQGQVLYELKSDERQETLVKMQTNTSIRSEKLDDGTTFARVLQPEPAYLVANILRDDSARWLGFGSRSELVIKDKDVAVKTGTTNDVRDNWTIGFTPSLLTAIWVGNTDGSAMNSRLVSGVTGAAPIWNDAMTWLLKDAEITWPEAPEGIKTGDLCWTGMPWREVDQEYDPEGNPLPNGCGDTKRDLYWEDSIPTRSSVRQESIYVCSATGMPPVIDELGQELDCGEKNAGDYLIAQDPLLNYYCINCPRLTDENGRVAYESAYIVQVTDSPSQYGD